MKLSLALLSAAAMLTAAPAIAADGPTDPQIAHIAYTAGNIDIAAGKQALAKLAQQGGSQSSRRRWSATTTR